MWLWGQKGSSIHTTHASRHLTQQLLKTRNCYTLTTLQKEYGILNKYAKWDILEVKKNPHPKPPSEMQNSTTICSGNIPETSRQPTFFTLSAIFPQPHICLCGQKTAKIMFHNIKANSAESPSIEPSTMWCWSVFPGAACPSSLLPAGTSAWHTLLSHRPDSTPVLQKETWSMLYLVHASYCGS